MDKTESVSDQPRGEQQSPAIVPLIGPWTIEKNPPYGFVIRNTEPASLGQELHFWFDSNGWFTARKNGEVAGVFNANGKTNLIPHLCDKASTEKFERIQDLKQKGHTLTEAERTELLVLCGLIPEKD